MKRITVVGSGTMGHGIAQVSAQAGYEVVMVDVSEDLLRRAVERIRWSLSKFAEKGRIAPQSIDEVLSRIGTTTSIPEGVRGSDLIIEAVPEDVKLKREVFLTIDSAARRDALIASNTSTIPITELQEYVSNPQRFLGLHFFNPPQLMQLVEVIKGDKTSDETLRKGVEYVKGLGKEPIVCLKDIPGFIVNRILIQLFYVASLLVEGGVLSIEQVDSAVRNKVGLPMGLFELADYVGLDTAYLVGVEIASRDSSFKAIKLFGDLFKDGKLGVKSGAGFYAYPKGVYERPSIPKEAGEGVDYVRIMAPGINMAAQMIERGVASMEDVEKGVKLGLGFPKGILEMADEYGIDVVVEKLGELARSYGETFTPSPLLTRMVEEGRLGVKSGAGFYDYRRGGARYSEIELHREPPVAWLILNRPQRMNAITPTMLREISDALQSLRDDKEVRVVVIRGAGDRAFSVGADVTLFTSEGASPMRAMLYSEHFTRVLNEIEDFPKPTVAAIDGYALGGGLEISLACDFRLASERSRLGQPEIRLGLIPGASGTQRLTKMLGMSRAKELIMLGRQIDAAEAQRIGLVTYTYPTDRFEEETKRFASELAELPPLALMSAKIAIKAASETSLSDGQRIESSLFGLLFSTRDMQEGVSAFLSKKKASFRGE